MELLLILLFPIVVRSSNITVNTISGTVVGSTVLCNRTLVKEFLGIPFAEPPVGKLRFRKTVPVQRWSKPLRAYSFPPSCVQYYPFKYPWVDNILGQSEDCLYLNIWVPESASKRNLKAVMFWIYSGGFNSGSNRLSVYDGHVLAAEGDVIVVTINYRVSILGFLSTDSDEAPGNMGLYDIAEALRWVNSNIEAFGGDRKRITVFGQSAGGMIAGFLTTSPLVAGLFQRIIMQSGSALIMLGDTRKKNFDLGQQVAEKVRCASNTVTLKDNPNEVVRCLRSKSAEDLVSVVNSLRPTDIRTFYPVYEHEFLPVEPRKSILNGHFHDVDVLAGVVKDDGSYLLLSKAPELCGPYGERDPKINKTGILLKNGARLEELILIYKNFTYRR